jgi:hypothetical protein
MKAAAAALGLSILMAVPQQASAWGDEGHMTVALIAQHFLKPDLKTQIAAMLAADTDNLTKHDIGSEATWADKYRDKDAYGNQPLSKATPQHLSTAYVAQAERDVAQQLSKAGVRLAYVLNSALEAR